jgi:hypothetical protein
MNTDVLIIQCDHWIRTNEVTKAIQAIKSVSIHNLERQQCLPFAKLARRTGLFNIGIRVLKSLVQSGTDIYLALTDAERAEFAVCLSRLGAYVEALKVVETISDSNDPDVCFARFSVMFVQWQYREALPYVQAMIDSSKSTAVQRLTGRVNLAAIHLFSGELELADQVLREARAQASTSQHQLLYFNTLEQSAHLEILRGRYDVAKRYIDEGNAIFGSLTGVYKLFLEKWEAILELKIRGLNLRTRSAIQGVQDKARAIGHFETVRECDFQLADATQDQNLFHKIYFGTLFEPYRNEMCKRFSVPVAELPESFYWTPSGQLGSKPDFVLDGLTGQIGRSSLKTNTMTLNLLRLLSKDFYKRFRLPEIFSHLYLDQMYDPNSSPARVHQLLKRTRSWISLNKVPLKIYEKDGGFYLWNTEPMAVKVNVANRVEFGPEAHLRQVLERADSSEISANRVCELLGVSLFTATACLRWGIKNGLILRLGRTKGAKYQILNERCLNHFRMRSRRFSSSV